MPRHTTPAPVAHYQAPYYERKVEDMALDTAALNDIRGYVKKRVGYLQYRVGTTYTKAPITDAQILSSGVVRVQASIVPGAVTINRVELYNNAGELWAHQDVSITLDQEQTGVLYWFDFTIREAE